MFVEKRASENISVCVCRKKVQHFEVHQERDGKGRINGSQRGRKTSIIAVMQKSYKVGGARGTERKEEWIGREQRGHDSEEENLGRCKQGGQGGPERGETRHASILLF